ncbi:uncharacterized protein [Leptinotarsa decemlineata]|uniref:uncharacterized protein n=1 Tax=Leptinotarsa decemlineata TaxID=7539 RepID=UPI003D30C23A
MTSKPKRQQWDKDSMAQAILAIQEKKMGFLKASKTFGVPKTTLIRLSQKSNMPLKEVINIKLGRKATLPPELETDLADYVLHMEESGFGLTRRDIKLLAYQLAEKNNLTHKFSKENQLAGKTWLRLFLKRHPELSFRRPTGTSIARLKGFNKENVDEFFKLLEEAMEKHNYLANNIYNVDETGITVVPSKMPEILAKKGKRQIVATTSAERGSTVTCVMCMNASGTFVPPMMIFPRKRDHPLLMKGAPPGAIHACHPSGWIQTDLFTKWFKHFLKYAKPSTTSPVLLVLDGHASHTRNIELIDLARANHVQLLSLPPHSSHKIQPLDRTFMGPLKKYFTEEIRQFVRRKSQAATHYDIAELFGRAYIRAQRAELAINGFRVTGIYPIDRSVFQDHDFIVDQSIADEIPATVTAQSTITTSVNNDEAYDSDRTVCDESPSIISEPNFTACGTQSSIEDIISQNPAETSLVELIGEIEPIAVNEIQTLTEFVVLPSEQESPEIEVAASVLPSIETNIDVNPGPSTSIAYLSPKQLFPVPQLRKKANNRGRKGTKSTILTSSPYKLCLETSIKTKSEAESKKKRNVTKKLEELNEKKAEAREKKGSVVGQKQKKSAPKKRPKSNRKQLKKTKQIKIPNKVNRSSSTSEDSNYSVNDLTDESPDRSQQHNAKCLYCDSLFSDDTQGEQWVQCSSCEQWAHEECAGVDSVHFLCEFCSD